MRDYPARAVEGTPDARIAPEETLVVLAGALGDVVLRLPILRALGRVRVLAPRAWGPMLVEARLACRGDRLDDPALLPLWGAGGDVEALRGVRRAVLTARDPLLERSLRARCEEVLALDPDPPPGAHQAIHLLRQLGSEVRAPEALPAPLSPVPAAWEAALAPDVLLLPGSGGAAKCWPLAQFEALIQALRAAGRSPVVMLGPDELERGWVVRGAPVLEAPPLRETAAILSRARVVVGNDAGTSHLAAAVGSRVIALFGPTDPLRWRPLGPRVTVLRFGEAALGVEEVLAAVG